MILITRNDIKIFFWKTAQVSFHHKMLFGSSYLLDVYFLFSYNIFRFSTSMVNWTFALCILYKNLMRKLTGQNETLWNKISINLHCLYHKSFLGRQRRVHFGFVSFVSSRARARQRTKTRERASISAAVSIYRSIDRPFYPRNSHGTFKLLLFVLSCMYFERCHEFLGKISYIPQQIN